MALNPVAKDSIIALAGVINPKSESEPSGGTETVADFVQKLLAEPDKKIRKQMMKDFSSRRSDVAKFIKDNEDLINAEAEMALIASAVGTTVTEKEISYSGGRKSVKTKKKAIAPNVGALNIYLKNRMPDKYSDKPQTEIEIESLDDIEKEIYGDEENST